MTADQFSTLNRLDNDDATVRYLPAHDPTMVALADIGMVTGFGGCDCCGPWTWMMTDAGVDAVDTVPPAHV